MILRVTANDRDFSSKFSEICSYHIIGDEGPFLIDQGGVITNTVPLSSQKYKTHLLSVVATDCGGKESHPVLVEILTLPRCKTSWTDVSTSMTYTPRTGLQLLLPAAYLSLCSS